MTDLYDEYYEELRKQFPEVELEKAIDNFIEANGRAALLLYFNKVILQIRKERKTESNWANQWLTVAY